MAKITIDFSDLGDQQFLRSVLKKMEEHRTKELDYTKPQECPLPNKEYNTGNKDWDKAAQLADEQKYTLCRFQSLQRLMFDLQNDLSKKEYPMSAGLIRNTMRRLKDAEDDYLLRSRGDLSDLVNDSFHKDGPIGESRIEA